MSPVVEAALLHLGHGCRVDEGALLGYLPARKVEDLRLRIGAGAVIRHGTIVYAGSTIGAGLETGHYVILREENRIGENVRIWNHSVVDYGCQIGDGVRIHNHVYVAQHTVLEDEVFLAPGVQLANDPHPICTLCMHGPTIRRGARIGVNVTILPHVVVGEYALIGAGSVVTQDIPDRAVAYGNPACVHGTVDELGCPFDIVERPYLEGLDVQTRLRRGDRVLKEVGKEAEKEVEGEVEGEVGEEVEGDG